MSSSSSPEKTREIQDRFFNSTVWNDFAFRDGDIIIVTYAKSGTTWVQQIAAQLIFGGHEPESIWSSSPWFDLRILDPEVRREVEKQTHRRFLKSHLPADALVISPRAKYIYIARDGRDTALSYFNHHFNANDEYFARFRTDECFDWPPFERCENDPLHFFRRWLEHNGAPYWPFWEHVSSWWALRDQPNVLLLHFADMKSDHPAAVRRIADFIGISTTEDTLRKIVEQSGFEYMKANAERFAPRGGAGWDGGANTFIHKGTNGRWREILTEADVKAYETKAEKELGPACAKWLAEGKQHKQEI
jgi:aryl sulfotransferase